METAHAVIDVNHVVEASGSLVEDGRPERGDREGVVGSEMDTAGIAESCSGRCSASSGAEAHIEAVAAAHWGL